MPKKKTTNKMPYGDNNTVAIYGIICLKTKKLLKVHLSENEIWYEFNTGMYDVDKYSVIKLDVKLE